MGLVPTPEHRWAKDSIESIATVIERYIDMSALIDIADSVPTFHPANAPDIHATDHRQIVAETRRLTPKIGIIRDSAFQFYYPENLEALTVAGAELTYFSPLETDTIPAVDGIYIGGGFPETHAEVLAQNEPFRDTLKHLANDGLPIYAECGGLMYLGRELVMNENTYPMVGVLPISYGFSKRPQGHGYTNIAVEGNNPFFKVGSQYRGHEFHYSRVLAWQGPESDLVFKMKRGAGIWNGRDGACYKNVLATFTHLHAHGAPGWAAAIVRAAINYRRQSEQ
jgi:cobyrinic acid a,c-diamide synthase